MSLYVGLHRYTIMSYIHDHIHRHMHTCMYTYIHMYSRTHTHTHTHTPHIHTHTDVFYHWAGLVDWTGGMDYWTHSKIAL